jgi:EmrB/QacA subfamily drug resistance transporter
MAYAAGTTEHSASAGDSPDSGARSGVVLLLACATTFVVFLDVTVVHVAFPDLRAHFPTATISSLSWVVTAYAVAFAALLTPAGRLADVLGRRRLFLAGLALFTAASLGSALAPSVTALIVARAVQGLAGATMIPAALGLVLASTPAEKRVSAIGAWGAAASVAAAAGPTIGGGLVQAFDWRAVFYVNVPIGLTVLALGPRLLPDVRPRRERLPDAFGTLLVIAALATTVVGLTKAGEWGWGATSTLACLGAGLVLVPLALLRARRRDAPAVETSLWSNRMFAAANLTVLVFGAAIYSWMLLCILFLTSYWGYSFLIAGLGVTHGAVSSAVSAGVTGRIADWRKRRAVVVVGAIALAADGLWLSQGLTRTPDYLGIWLPAGLIGGAAMGAVLTGLASAAATSIPAERFAAGVGMQMTAREVGGAIGVAALAAILEAQHASFNAMLEVFAFAGAVAAVAALAAVRLRPSAEAEALQEPAGALQLEAVDV